MALTLVLVIATIGGYAYYRYLDSGIDRRPFNVGKSRPPETGALNVLLVGSDSREGDNKKYGPQSQHLGERTDTIMLLHISPNRDNATMISFPRDSMVLVPECQGHNGGVLPAGIKQINAAFNEGGIECTARTLESLTNIKINHFVKVDFTGFKGIVDAIGGIEICLPKPVNDPKAKLVLDAGKHVVKGEQALGYVRTRYALGDGSDLSRIQRQQVFLQQVMKKITDGGLLTDPGGLNDFLRAATKSVTVDEGLTLERMLEIANSVRGMTAKELKGITVPTEPWPQDKNRVQFAQPAARDFFENVRNDVEVTKAPTPGKSSAPAVKREQVRLQVLNATGEEGKALQVADALAAQGFVVTQVGNATPPPRPPPSGTPRRTPPTARPTVKRWRPGSRRTSARPWRARSRRRSRSRTPPRRRRPRCRRGRSFSSSSARTGRGSACCRRFPTRSRTRSSTPVRIPAFELVPKTLGGQQGLVGRSDCHTRAVGRQKHLWGECYGE
ncbi:LCP family protein [Nonomuraea salmonea]|uniref:LCP family protein n=1 Tax=Nonomuraea salmonea TaxID=46181 RepID=UPI002FEC259F